MLLSLLGRYKKKRNRQNLFRNFLFGVEDSLVSTVGLLSGITTAQTQQSTIVVAGIILIFVEAFSMGIGSFLSEDNSKKSDHSPRTHRRIASGAFIMFISYLLAGIIPLAPYYFFLPDQAILISIALSFFSLAILGLYSASHNRSNPWRSTIEMVVLGGMATLIGIVVGSLLG